MDLFKALRIENLSFRKIQAYLAIVRKYRHTLPLEDTDYPFKFAHTTTLIEFLSSDLYGFIANVRLKNISEMRIPAKQIFSKCFRDKTSCSKILH